MISRVTLNALLCDDEAAKTVVNSLYIYGVAIIDHVPANARSTELAVRQLFNISGDVWTSKRPDDSCPTCTADGGSGGVHTHQTFLQDPAGIMAIHGTSSSAQQQLSLIDGFNVVRKLQRCYSDAFDRLCRIQVPTIYVNEANKKYMHSAPVITLNSITKEPEHIRYAFFFNMRILLHFFSSFNMFERDTMNSMDQIEMQQFYKDLRLLLDEVQQLHSGLLQLMPGTLVLIDNWRVLLAHQAAPEHTNRVGDVVGCYVARSEFLSVARQMGVIG